MPRGKGDTILYENFDEHAIVAHLRDGRVVAWSKLGKYVTFGTDREYDTWLQRVPDLKYIEYVLQVQFDWGLPTTATKTTTVNGKAYKMMVYAGVGKSKYGNVVGMTLLGGAEALVGGTLTGVSTGTSVYCEIIAIGPP